MLQVVGMFSRARPHVRCALVDGAAVFARPEVLLEAYPAEPTAAWPEDDLAGTALRCSEFRLMQVSLVLQDT